MANAPDRASIAAKGIAMAEHIDLIVIGAGAAGVAAAIEARALGLQTMLVDENPISFETAAEDVPFHFGGAMGGALRHSGRTLEAFIDNRPDIAEAFEAGVDVRLGNVVLGLFVNGATLGWLPGPVALISDGAKVTAIGFAKAIIATGRRDMGLAFPGWEIPGVMGVTAASLLGASYRALHAQAFVMIGSGNEALLAAAALHRLGHPCHGIVEIADRLLGDDALAGECRDLGIPVYCGSTPARACADGHAGRVSRLVLNTAQGAQTIACDTVVLGVGVVPVIELFDVVGCAIETDYRRGGHVPVLVEGQRTSLPMIHAAGDCAGIWPAKSNDPEIAREEGRRAARQAAGLAAQPVAGTAHPPQIDTVSSARLAWLGGRDTCAFAADHVCRCEDVSAQAIVGLRPPAYLPPADGDPGSLESRLGVAHVDPDQIKRLTRAAMGACQGRRCREQIECLLAGDGGHPLHSVPRASYRYPVRPVSLRLMGSLPEGNDIAAHWDSWFGMPLQWVPHWKIPARYTATGSPREYEVGE